jgi:hypothetical protein
VFGVIKLVLAVVVTDLSLRFIRLVRSSRNAGHGNAYLKVLWAWWDAFLSFLERSWSL